MTTLATYWSMTINNPDDNDELIVRNPCDRYVRQVVHTMEVGENGTRHIQAWVRLQRNQSMAFMKKIYPRGHFCPITRDMYNENTHNYAQKNDETTAGQHIITLNDPLPNVDTLLYRVVEQSASRIECIHEWVKTGNWVGRHKVAFQRVMRAVEHEMVQSRAGLEKLLVSATYEKMERNYLIDILLRILHNNANAKEGTEGGGSEGTPSICEDGSSCGDADTDVY